MTDLSERPHLEHLKKQAKQLLRDALAGDRPALERIVAHLPVAKSLDAETLQRHKLILQDAQTVIARECGFKSWTELKRYVEWKQEDLADRTARQSTWLGWAYDGNARERRLALRMLREEPEFFGGDAWVACAVGDVPAVQLAIDDDPGWVNRKGGLKAMTPLAAVTSSRLILEEGFEEPLLKCAQLLLSRGADVDGKWIHPDFPDSPLSPLYGAAGVTHNVAMTKLLLDAGADPDDNESLYHSVEARDSTCMRLVLEAGARVTRTNAIGRVLDYDKLEDLQLMLRHGGDANESAWVHHAILRGRSIEHVRVLVDAGADLRAKNREGIDLFHWAQMHGRGDVVELLREHGIEEALTDEERFVAACAGGDMEAARVLLGRAPGMFSRLTEQQLKALPEAADVGNSAGVRTMLAVGWPVETKAAWSATALNLAAFRGDAEMVEMLLDAGADWRTLHGFKNNVLGTLSHASQEENDDAGPREFVGCMRALVEHGVPLEAMKEYTFSSEVTDYLDSVRLSAG